VSSASERARSSAVWALKACVISGFVVAVPTLRAVYSGEMDIAASTDALYAGDPHEAVVRARRAAGWYAPGAPHVRVAYERLIALAEAAEERGQLELAMLAWQGVRSAATETRWLTTPHAAHLDQANREIARLQSGAPRPPGTAREPASSIERTQLATLAQRHGPRTSWVIALTAAFSSWALGLFWVLRKGVDPAGRLSWRRSAPGLSVAILGIALWLAALWFA